MSQSPGTAQLEISQKYTFTPPVDADAIGLSRRTWNHIKDKVRRVRDPSNAYFTAGTVMIGGGLSALATAIVRWLISQGSRDNTEACIWVGIAVILIVCGIFALHVGKRHRDITSVLAADIVTFMEFCEESWFGAKVDEAPPDNLRSPGPPGEGVT